MRVSKSGSSLKDSAAKAIICLGSFANLINEIKESAGASGTAYQTWLPLKGAPPPAVFFRENPLRSRRAEKLSPTITAMRGRIRAEHDGRRPMKKEDFMQ